MILSENSYLKIEKYIKTISNVKCKEQICDLLKTYCEFEDVLAKIALKLNIKEFKDFYTFIWTEILTDKEC